MMMAIVAVALAVTRSVTSEKSWVFPHTTAAAADSVAIFAVLHCLRPDTILHRYVLTLLRWLTRFLGVTVR